MNGISTFALQRVARALGVAATMLLLAGSARALEVERIFNGDFDEDLMLTGWTVEPFANGSWDFDDVDGGTGSARVSLQNQVVAFGVGISQCIDVSPGESLDASAAVRVLPGSSSDNRGELRMSWHPGEDCTGGSPGGTIIGGSSLVAEWVAFSNTAVVPGGIESATVFAAVLRNSDGTDIIFQIDAISVLPEPDSAVGALAAVAVLALLGRRRRDAVAARS